MALLTLMILPVMTVTCAVIAGVALARGDDQLAGLASLHMAAVALAQIACWAVL